MNYFLFRILVGLRWFNVYEESGEEKWVYDSMDASKVILILRDFFYKVFNRNLIK